MNNIEEWKDVIGFEGIYKISSFGRVKSLARKSPPRFFNLPHYQHTGEKICNKARTYKEKYLKPSMDAEGYYHVRLIKDKDNHTLYKLHRLVAKHFLPEYQENLIVQHKDGNKDNNRADNLKLIKMLDRTIVRTLPRLLCEQTGEVIVQFKRWCRYNNIPYSKYFLIRHLRGIDETYRFTKYSFVRLDDKEKM